MREKFTIAAEAVGAVIKHFSSSDETVSYLHEIADGGTVRTTQLPEKIVRAISGLAISDQSPAADTTLCVSFAEAGIAATGSSQYHGPSHCTWKVSAKNISLLRKPFSNGTPAMAPAATVASAAVHGM